MKTESPQNQRQQSLAAETHHWGRDLGVDFMHQGF